MISDKEILAALVQVLPVQPREALKRTLEKLEAENAKLREENIALGGASTMVACDRCNLGVRPRYAVKGMCAECARARIDELEGQR